MHTRIQTKLTIKHDTEIFYCPNTVYDSFGLESLSCDLRILRTCSTFRHHGAISLIRESRCFYYCHYIPDVITLSRFHFPSSFAFETILLGSYTYLDKRDVTKQQQQK